MIGVVGMIRSGKGTVGNIIAEHWHSQHLPLSNRLREIAAAKGLDETFPRSELRKIDRQFKPRFGQDVFERWTMNLMRRLVKLHGYIGMSTDGYRGFRAAQNSKRLGGVLIAVLASQEIRYQRLLADGRLGDDYSFEKFLESDRIEREWIEPIFEICDYTIVNEGSDKELRDNTASVLAGVERK
jgi:dephospho-CoA kinase